MSTPDRLCPCCATPAPDTPASAPATAGYRTCPRCRHRWRAPRAAGPIDYAALSARNDPDTPWFRRKIDDRLDALASLAAPGRRILEVGCAEGELGRQLKARLPVQYDGIELSRDAEAARQWLDRVFQTPAAALPPPAAAYDLIVSFHVLEHLASPAAELAAWSTLLAPGGRLLVEVPQQAGHPLLESDGNPEHLHQFTPASLALLFAAGGFACRQLSAGHYESPVYPDSIRLVASRETTPAERRAALLERFRARLGGPFIVYGAGGDFANYVAPLAGDLDIAALLDSSPDKQGQRLGGHTVAAYDPARHGDLPVLIASIRFGAGIRRHLLELGIAPARLVGLEDVYDPA